MHRKIPAHRIISSVARLRVWLPVLALLIHGNAWAECPGPTGHDMPIGCATSPPDCSYAATPGATIPTGDDMPTIGVVGEAESVYWDLASGVNCSGSATSITCLGITVTSPTADSNVPVPQSARATLSGTAAGIGESEFTLMVTNAADTSITCTRTYRPRVTSSGGGWGDPHITTVDGVNYDFQSAGEYVALRGGALEVQTRQTAVATSTVPNFTNAYTGLKSCVSIYTAVAARVGTHRVTYQPNISGVPDPSGMQLRIDGILTELGPEGIILDAEETPSTTSASLQTPGSGQIVKSAAGDGIEIHYVDGTKLVVTPKWWASQQKWYLNVNIYDTVATQGIMGNIAPKSWLPALDGGTSVGPKPDSLKDRYTQLYNIFGESWRVTDETSLFDYAPGTSTATFTLADWPRENPTSCAIEGEPAAEAIDVAVAEKHCEGVADANNKANCIFDVAATGHPGFAEAYALSEQLAPGATTTTLSADKNASRQGESVTFTATVARTIAKPGGSPTGTMQFILDGSDAGAPVALDANAKAVWTTASLAAGTHQITAKFKPSLDFGERFLASSSPELSHTVATAGLPFWLIVLIIFVLILIMIGWFLRRR